MVIYSLDLKLGGINIVCQKAPENENEVVLGAEQCAK